MSFQSTRIFLNSPGSTIKSIIENVEKICQQRIKIDSSDIHNHFYVAFDIYPEEIVKVVVDNTALTISCYVGQAPALWCVLISSLFEMGGVIENDDFFVSLPVSKIDIDRINSIERRSGNKFVFKLLSISIVSISALSLVIYLVASQI